MGVYTVVRRWHTTQRGRKQAHTLHAQYAHESQSPQTSDSIRTTATQAHAHGPATPVSHLCGCVGQRHAAERVGSRNGADTANGHTLVVLRTVFRWVGGVEHMDDDGFFSQCDATSCVFKTRLKLAGYLDTKHAAP